MGTWFTIEDLALMGLGTDVVGAVVLASGLLVSTSMIREGGGTYWGWSSYRLFELIDNKVKGTIGVGLIVLGFALQTLSYLLALGNVSPDHHSHRAVAAGILALLAGAAFGATIYAALARRFRKAAMIDVALCPRPAGVEPNYEADLAMLVGIASVRWPAPGEPDDIDESIALAYVERVFGSRHAERVRSHLAHRLPRACGEAQAGDGVSLA
jgi:hypothetical protein